MENPRRRRLVAWFKGAPCNGSQDNLVQRSGLSKGRISQLFDKDEPFGERAARALAERLHLPRDYFETDAAAGVAPEASPPASMSEQELVGRLRPEWRELILAFEELLPEDREAMVQPMLKRAEDMRRHFEAALSRQGISHKPMGSAGNHLPVAPRHHLSELRKENVGHQPERRTAERFQDGQVPAAKAKAKKGQK